MPTHPTFDALAYWARSGLMMSVVGMDGTPGGPRPGMGRPSDLGVPV